MWLLKLPARLLTDIYQCIYIEISALHIERTTQQTSCPNLTGNRSSLG